MSGRKAYGKDIYLDLDRERLEEIVSAACEHIESALGTKLLRGRDALLLDFRKVIGVSRVSTEVYLDVSSPAASDMRLRVDLRRKEVLSMSARHMKAKNLVNSYLRLL